MNFAAYSLKGSISVIYKKNPLQPERGTSKIEKRGGI